jgi:Spy/CpxP family protein refolding chaperone
MATIERTPRQIRLITAVLLFATFLLGAAAGVGLVRWSLPPRPPLPPAPVLPGPPGALHLTPAQEAKAHEITERYRPQLDAVWRDSLPRLQELNEQMEKELREILTPEQRKILDEMKAHHPPPPPGAGFHPPGGPRRERGPFPGGPVPPGAPPPPPGVFGPPPGAPPPPSAEAPPS